MALLWTFAFICPRTVTRRGNTGNARLWCRLQDPPFPGCRTAFPPSDGILQPGRTFFAWPWHQRLPRKGDWCSSARRSRGSACCAANRACSASGPRQADNQAAEEPESRETTCCCRTCRSRVERNRTRESRHGRRCRFARNHRGGSRQEGAFARCDTPKEAQDRPCVCRGTERSCW